MSTAAEVPMSAAPRALPPQLVALVAPDAGMPRVAREGRARWMIAIGIACSLSLAGAQALRVSAHEETMQELEQSGQLKDTSDRQIDEQAKASERKFIVKNVAISVFRPPLLCLAYLGSLYLLSWFLRGRSKGGAIAAVAGAALLPRAIYDLFSAGAALTYSTLPTEGPPLIPSTLTQLAAALHHPLMGIQATLGNAVDFFSLWAALLVGFGLAAAASLTTRKALIGTLTAWLLWRLMFACAFHLGG